MINIILLAAGNSTRFGSNKLLYKIDKIPMYQKALSTYIDVASRCGGKVFFVTQYSSIIDSICDSLAKPDKLRHFLGHESNCKLNEIFNENHIVKNNHSEFGISYSIKLGIEKALHSSASTADDYLFSVCDQPFIKSETILDFIQNYRLNSKCIGCMSYKNEPGNPVIFKKLYLKELCALSGDVGGKKIVKRHMDDVFLYPVTDPKELTDLDTPITNLAPNQLFK